MLEDEVHGRRTKRFSLQWHITSACDLRCRHCYDRGPQVGPHLAEAERVLDDLVRFCRANELDGKVCLTGGNPFLHPEFFEIARAVAARQLPLSILGNPVPRAALVKLVAIAKPTYFQVSLEGLKAVNDAVRGEGTFDRVLAFLPVLGELGIVAIVMATLTRSNADQMIPLARLLRGKADGFSWNRLSQAGEGVALELPARDDLAELVMETLAERNRNPTMTLKDNLGNVVLDALGQPLFGGCTGFGCGAAFNFVALLPNGEIHACRKFPSPIGHIGRSSLDEVWRSAEAQRYRRGSAGCDGCRIRHRCGGCLAVTRGQGLDPFVDRDPFCFIDDLAAFRARAAPGR
jgi:selenobiotic family peptide radical SAM maturase